MHTYYKTDSLCIRRGQWWYCKPLKETKGKEHILELKYTNQREVQKRTENFVIQMINSVTKHLLNIDYL